MALNIIHPGQPLTVTTLRVLIYGQPGVGKSSVGFTFSRPLVLDFDRGSHRSEQNSLGTKIRIDNWADILDIERATNNFEGYDTIVIDTISKCLDYLQNYIIQQNPKAGNNRGGLSMNGWGELAVGFKNWIHKMTNLGKDVVMIAQYSEEKDGDNVRKRPKVQGKQALALILEEAEFVGFTYMNNNRRTVTFTPTDDTYGKDSARLGTIELPDFNTDSQFGAALMKRMKEAFNRLSAEQMETMQHVATWRDTIDGFTTASDFNKILNSVLAMPEGALKAQVMAIMKLRREKLSVAFDPATRQFIDPPTIDPPTPEPAQAPPPAQQPAQAPPQATAPAVAATPPAAEAPMNPSPNPSAQPPVEEAITTPPQQPQTPAPAAAEAAAPTPALNF